MNEQLKDFLKKASEDGPLKEELGALAGLPEGLDWPIRPVYGDVIRLRTPEHLRPLLTRTVRGPVSYTHLTLPTT